MTVIVPTFTYNVREDTCRIYTGLGRNGYKVEEEEHYLDTIYNKKVKGHTHSWYKQMGIF